MSATPAYASREVNFASPTLVASLCLVVACGIATATMVAAVSHAAALFPIAYLLGVLQFGGRCGVAHVNTMGALWRARRLLWFRCAALYTVFGLLSSVAVGAAAGAIGGLLSLPNVRWIPLGVGAVAILLLLRELGAIRIRLPERPWQTNRAWAYSHGFAVASAMWGFHIGVGFATVVTYGGYYAMALAVVAEGSVVYGCGIFGAYWLGRATPLWILPAYSDGKQYTCDETYRPLRAANCLALGGLAVLMLFA